MMRSLDVTPYEKWNKAQKALHRAMNSADTVEMVDAAVDAALSTIGGGGVSEYQYVGDFSATPPWFSVSMRCDDCMIEWTGCWDNFQCPKCGQGELPNCDPPTTLTKGIV